MAAEVIAGIYDSRDEADVARARLIEEGIPGDRIAIEQQAGIGEAPMSPVDRDAGHGAEPPPERGFAGVVSRMFSGALMDDAHVARYSDALARGRCVVVVRVESADARHAASTILERGGPRVYALPNAPTGWNEAHANDAASIGGVDDDPLRPQGLLSDAEGLPVAADRAPLAKARGR